jgi:hypothetical protein
MFEIGLQGPQERSAEPEMAARTERPVALHDNGIHRDHGQHLARARAPKSEAECAVKTMPRACRGLRRAAQKDFDLYPPTAFKEP